MAYRILYGDAILWDPYSDAGNALSDVSMTMTVNAAKYLDFTMPPTHDLYDEVAEKHKTVRVYSDKKIIYKGYITEISLDIYGYKSISCTSVLAYLNDTHVRDYSTIEGEQPLKAPAEIDGLFKWYIEQHNSHVRGVDKQFRVGINQAQQLNSTNHVYRSSTQFPTTAEEIENKILDMGGYMFERYDGDANVIDFYSDAHEANTQILDFGINITDFTKETTTDDQYTAIYASGYTPDPPEDDQEKEMKPINLGDISDSDFKYAGGDLVKVGDIIYSHSAVSRYGYKEYYYSNDDITTLDYLQEAASKVLNTLIAPVVTLNVNAVDLALFMDNGYEHLQLGQAVRVRSKPHNVDEYLMISAIDLDLQDPGNTSYTIGATYDTLTGQQSSFIKGLNSNINTALDSVTKLDEETKKNALDAAEAERRAKAAEEAAKNAQSTADKAQEAADAAADDAKKGIDDAKAAADAAADARDKNDALTERVSLAEKQVTQITGDTATAIQNAKNAQDAADAAKTAADNAQASANEAYSMIGNANSQIEDIKDNITGIKEDATSLRDDLQGQITTVTNTMTADYARKTDLTSTTETLRNETTESAAQFKRELSLDYAKKSDLQTTVEDLSNRIANDYSTKATVEQLADRISQTVSSLEVTSIDPEALNETIKKAQAAADEAEAEATKAEAAVTTAKNAATAANNALASAKKTMEELQGNEDATYEQLTAAREQVDAAQTAANEANAAATAAEDYAVAARATANEAKKQVDIVSNLGDMKGRIKQAETKIEQNDQAIALSATKKELANLSVGGRNLWLKTADPITMVGQNKTNQVLTWPYNKSFDYNLKEGDWTVSCHVEFTGTNTSGHLYMQGNGTTWTSFSGTAIDVSDIGDGIDIYGTMSLKEDEECSNVQIRIDNVSGTLTFSKMKLERGNKPTDWSPAPEDLVSEANSYTDSSLTITADGISQKVTDVVNGHTSKISTMETTVNSIKSIVSSGSARTFKFVAASGNNNNWSHVGDWVSSDNHSCHIIIYSGSGYNANANQNSKIDIFIKDGWQSSHSTTDAYGYTVTLDQCTEDNVKVKVIATAYNTCQVWVWTSWSYAYGYYAVDINPDSTWTDVSTAQAAEPEGAAQNGAFRPNAGEVSGDLSNFQTTQTQTNTDFSRSISTLDDRIGVQETLIRETEEGVEVAYLVNGAYQGNRTLQGTDAFYIKSKDGTNLAKYAASEIDLGMNSASSKINMCGGTLAIGSTTTSYGTYNTIKSNDGLSIASTYPNGANWSSATSIAVAGLKTSSTSGNFSVNIMNSGYSADLNLSPAYIDIGEYGASGGSGITLNGPQISINSPKFNNTTTSYNLNDIVIAQGSTTNTNDSVTWRWYYRQYASKKITLWGYASHTANMKNGYGGNHFYESVSCTFPFTITARVPQVTVRCASGLLSASIHTETSTSLGMFIFENGTSAKTSGTVYVNVHVDGVYS